MVTAVKEFVAVKTEFGYSYDFPSKCEKCGGLFLDEYYEKRIVCLNCGAQMYYGLPENPAQILNQFWELAMVQSASKYQPTRPGAIITLGGGTAHYVDSGCKESPRCQECPLSKCSKGEFE